MEKIFLRVVDLSIMASWIVLAVMIIRIVFRKAPKWINCVLWAIVAVRLVCPFTVESPFSLMPEMTSVSDLLGLEAVSQQSVTNNSSSNQATRTDNSGSQIADIDSINRENENNSNINNSNTSDNNTINNNTDNSNTNSNNTNNSTTNSSSANNSNTSNNNTNNSNINNSTSNENTNAATANGQISDNHATENISSEINANNMNSDTAKASWVHAVTIIWLVGISIMLTIAIISYVRLKLKVRTAVPLMYKETQKRDIIYKNAHNNIRQSENISSPFVLGTVKPRIYLPFSIGDESLDYIIAHEQAHIKRHDNWVKIIAFVILAVYWFNPFIWLVYILLCKDIELACDEKVVKDQDSEYKKSYAKALLANSVSHRAIAVCPLAFGEVGVKSRVKNIISYKKPAFLIVGIALAAGVITACSLLTSPAGDNANENATKAPSEEDITKDNSESSEAIAEAIVASLKKADITEYDFGIKLPDGAYVAEQHSQLYKAGVLSADDTYVIKRDDYNEGKSLAGWVELYSGSAGYEYVDGIYPHPSEDVIVKKGKWSDYQAVASGYLCEAELEADNARYWCIIFETELGYEKHSDWIYLNKECFTEVEAKAVAESYIPDWECYNYGNEMYKGDTIYVIEDDKATPTTTVTWNTADVEYTSKSSRVGEIAFSFQWCEYNGGIYLRNSEYNRQGSGWTVYTIPDNNDEVIVAFWASAVCDFARYNLKTGETNALFSKLPKDTMVMSEPKFTNDYSKAVMICDDGAKVYYYDINNNKVTDLSEVFTLNDGMLLAIHICQEKVFLFMENSTGAYITVYDYDIKSGKISENAIGDVKFASHDDKNYIRGINEEYFLNCKNSYESGVLEFYNLNTGERIPTEIPMENVSYTKIGADTVNKTVEVVMNNDEVWLVNYTTGEIVDKIVE